MTERANRVSPQPPAAPPFSHPVPAAHAAHPGASPRVMAAAARLRPALAFLAGTLAVHGEPYEAPFARFGVPGLLELDAIDTLVATDVGAAAEATIALVRAVFQGCRKSGPLTTAAKRAGTAALGVRRALASDAARAARIALRELGELGHREAGAMGARPAPQAPPGSAPKPPAKRRSRAVGERTKLAA